LLTQACLCHQAV